MNEREAMQSVGLGQGDEVLAVLFYMGAVQNAVKTKAEGRPIFDDLEHISIRKPGSHDEIKRVARLDDKTRFRLHYEAFKARVSQESLSGTPLVEWTGVTRSQVEELKWLNMTSVEQLAGCSDQNCQSMRGLLTLKQKALAYLEASEGSVEIEELRAANAALMARLEALEAKPAKRKRRSKAEMEAARLNKDME
jgi:hypothetical protein